MIGDINACGIHGGWASEASAVQRFTYGPCTTGPTGNSGVSVTPAGDWQVDTAAQQNPPPLDTIEMRVYTYTAASPPDCTPSTSTLVLYRARVITCPTPYLDGIENGATTTCYSAFTGNVTAQLLECPQNGSGSTVVGDPCDVSTGDQSQTESDYGAAGLVFARYYHSAVLESDHTLGVGWTHSYAAYLVLTNGAPTGMSRPDGHHDAIQLIGGAYTSLSGAGIQVQQTGDNWVATLHDGSSETYNATGQLIQETTAAGLTTNLTYSGGQLVAVTGPFGHSLQFAYDGAGRMSTITEPDGSSTITFSYGANNNLTSVTYPDGSSRQYLYENASFPNNLTGIVDENNARFLTVQYDPTSGAVTSSQQAGGAQAISITYGANSAVVTDALSTTSTYTFNSDFGYAPRLTGLLRNGVNNTYAVPAGSSDPQRRVSVATDANGVTTFFSYDSYHLISKTEAAGTPRARTTSYQYLATNIGLPTLISQPMRQTSFTFYSGTNNIHTRTITDTTVTPNVARTWTYTYDSFGRVLTEDGPRTDVSDVTSYTYFTCTTGAQCGQVQTMTDAAGNVTTYNAYNADGQPPSITDPNGTVTSLTYDARQRLKSRQIGTEVTTFDYWPTGLLRKVALADGSSLQYTYDNAHRLTKIADDAGNSIIYTLDAMGNRIAENAYDSSNVLHRTHTRAINALNEVYQEINAAGTAAVTTTFGYDGNGNVTSVSAPLSRNTQQTFDELNRTSQITDPALGVTHLSYDASDDLISLTDPRSLSTTYVYDGFGEMVSQVSPDTGTSNRTYDSAGNLATATDARGAVSSYTYDALNRVSSVTYSTGGGVADQAITFTYDAGTNGKGHLTGAADAAHSLSWSYDGQGRVAGKTQTVGTIALSVGYAYTNGDLTTLTTPAGRTITYGYSGNHQVASVSVNGILIASDITYEPFGALNGWTWGNGSPASRTYDADGNVTQLASSMTKSYSYDDAARLTAVNDSANPAASWSYGYDSLDRITSAAAVAQSESFAYDANGNRLSQDGSTRAALAVDPNSNRITGVTGGLTRGYSYDAAGSTLSSGAATFTYNSAGRITSATTANGTTNYLYNALGQRVRKTSPNSTTYFVYDEVGHLIGEYDSMGGVIEEIVWLGDTPIAAVRLEACGFSVFYIHTDQLNTPRRITRRSTTDVVWSWESDPFGATSANENPSGLGIFPFNLRFPGQYYDVETGLNYNMQRDYDPATGRYVESDPLGLIGGINTYGYADQNPVRLTDPLGLRPPTDAEVAFISKYIGACLDPKTLNIRVRRLGDTSRALSLGGGFTSFPSFYFVDGSGNNELRLDNTYIASIVGHEALHQMQRASGVNVTLAAAWPQVENTLHLASPYDYQNSSDPAELFQTFLGANVEAQGQIFENYLFALLNHRDVSAYKFVAAYIKGNCACSK